jgi:hypothetical protein
MTEMHRIVDWLLPEAKSLSDDLVVLNPKFNQGDIRRPLTTEGG